VNPFSGPGGHDTVRDLTKDIRNGNQLTSNHNFPSSSGSFLDRGSNNLTFSLSVSAQAGDFDMVGSLGHPRALAIGDDDGADAGVPQALTRLFHPPER